MGRAARLSPEDREVIEAAAAIGALVDADVLNACLDGRSNTPSNAGLRWACSDRTRMQSPSAMPPCNPSSWAPLHRSGGEIFIGGSSPASRVTPASWTMSHDSRSTPRRRAIRAAALSYAIAAANQGNRIPVPPRSRRAVCAGAPECGDSSRRPTVRISWRPKLIRTTSPREWMTRSRRKKRRLQFGSSSGSNASSATTCGDCPGSA